MEVEQATWHYAVAMAAFALFGAAAHVVRAVCNLFPDKISDTAVVNILVSRGYGWADHLFGSEFDEGGYYRLDSSKNLKLSVAFTVAGGMLVLLASEEAAQGMSVIVETGCEALIALFRLRVEEIFG
ncbi:hypothetical protein [Pseudohoeflea coraliihabitans]|uniref:Uncharacterized protein n=1 Tax=Pseudohoeflea coraliihabitans TaxID=2860393 RepID=A0ABS6WKC1_9HYPH|nr:hypothetical protein [Pseudohoeflea sp. DP4N28-3]MBW3096108.1 hypothetical protein [Pseudohoeflea sp. DP4N28-3]